MQLPLKEVATTGAGEKMLDFRTCGNGYCVRGWATDKCYNDAYMEEKSYRIERCDGKVQWDEFILEHNGHPLQLWGWGDARATLGWQIDRIFIVEEDRQIGAAQLFVKKLTRPFGLCVYIPRGPLVVKNEAAVYEQVISYVKKAYHGVALIVEPTSEGEPGGSGWRESAIHSLAPRTILLKLEKADGVLLAEMDQFTREHIRAAGQSNLTVKKLGSTEDIAACYKLYRETCLRRNEKPYKEKYFHELNDKLGDFSVIFGVFEGDDLLSFLWLAVSESTAVELYSGISRRGFETSADYGLRWEAIRRIKRWGVPVYDIEGADPQNESDVKRGFGNEFTDRGTFILPLSPFYTLWSKASRNRTNYAK